MTVPSPDPPPDQLPQPPRYDLWPDAVRAAERLHGGLVPCGPGLRGVGWPETPRVRLAALLPWLLHGSAPVGMTAAWVWGAARQPGSPLTLSTTYRRRNRRPPSEDVRVSHFRLGDDDLQVFGPAAVTTPLRTVIDVLLLPAPFGTEAAVAVRLLCQAIDGGAAAVHEHLVTHRRPGAAVALRRLTDCSGYPAFTR